MFLSVVAGVARDMLLAIRELRVDVVDHLDHVPGGFLLRIIVRGKISLNMAEIAILRAEGDSIGLHEPSDIRTVG